MTDICVDLARLGVAETTALVEQAQSLRLAPDRGGLLKLPAAQIAARLPVFGRQVQQSLALAADGQLPAYERFVGRLLPADLLPRTRLWLPTDSAADMVPWEAACDSADHWLALDPMLSLVHRTGWNAYGYSEHLATTRPSVLVVTAMPRGLPSANVELQRSQFNAIVRKFEHTTAVIRWSEHRDLALVRQEIAQWRCSILHVIAHGRPGKVLWVDQDQAVLPLDARDFCHQLAGVRLDVVVFTVCDSASATPPGRSLAAEAVDSLAHAAIGMRSSLDESAAAVFTRAFYDGLFSRENVSLDHLVSLGREALHTAALSGSIGAEQWLQPTYVVRDTGVRFAASESLRRPSITDTGHHGRIAASLEFSHGAGAPLTRRRTTIGRSAKADVRLRVPTVRPFHAVIHKTDTGYELQALGGGSTVNGISVHRMALSDGDVLDFEGCVCRFTMEADH